jgi:hypothetical protein
MRGIGLGARGVLRPRACGALLALRCPAPSSAAAAASPASAALHAAPAQVQQVFEAHQGEGLWAVVNCVGDFNIAKLQEMEPADLVAQMETNVVPAFNILKVRWLVPG